jgi:anti-sigma B factor antagonist
MKFEERIVGDIAIVTVTGDLTLKQTVDMPVLQRVRSLIQRGHKKVLLNVAGVSFIDSAGLGELVQTHSAMKDQGGALKLFSPTSRLRDLLALTRLTTVLGLYDDEAGALASFDA